MMTQMCAMMDMMCMRPMCMFFCAQICLVSSDIASLLV